MKDTMEVQKVEMKDARTPEKTTEKTNAPKTGDNQKIWAFVLLTGICWNSYRSDCIPQKEVKNDRQQRRNRRKIK